MSNKYFASCIAALATLGPGTAAVAAQDSYPSRPIRLVVPYSPGGPADVLSRMVGDKLAPRLKQPVVIDNRPGAGGHVGGEQVAKATPDGYTLVLSTIAHNGAQKLYRNLLRYNPATDLEPVILLAESPSVLLVHEGVPARSVQELLTLARARPGALKYASAGNGSAMHLAAELFRHMTKVDYVHIPYRGGAPAMADLLGGQVQLAFDSASTAQQYIKTGKVRPLAVTSLKRNSSLPDVPTLDEAGVRGYSSMPWYTISAPRGVPQPIVEKLNAEMNAVLKMPDVLQRLETLGAVAIGGTRADAVLRNQVETRKWSEVIDAAGLTAE